MKISRASFQSSLKRIAIYANKTTNQVVLKLEEDKLSISAQDIDFANEADEVLQCEYKGDPFTISFSAKFLIEMLGIINSDEVELHLEGPSRAGILVPENQEEGQDLLMLVMPVMVAY
jgi:DNA polymerase-3 subunit beta